MSAKNWQNKMVEKQMKLGIIKKKREKNGKKWRIGEKR